MITVPLPSISPAWKPRLHTALQGAVVFSARRNGAELVTRGESRNSRVLLELVAREGMLTRASLQLALPQADDLEMIKLGCWTLLFLKSLFPDWSGVELWVKDAAESATESGEPVQQELQGYRIACIYDPAANVLDFLISRN
jgi:hypothetical protein